MSDQLRAIRNLLARSGKVIESEILGTSMGQTLPSGSRIRIHPLHVEQYDVGQVVAFVSGDRLLAHRVVCCTRQGFLTRGDNRSWCDLPVPFDDVLGAVKQRWTEGKWQDFHEDPHALSKRSRSARVAEAMLRACMRIDIRLARHSARALMHLARMRRRLLDAAFGG